MSSDANLLSVLKNRSNYKRFQRFVKDYSVSKECYLIFKGMDDYYGSYPTHSEIDWDLFEVLFFALKAKHLKEDVATTCRAIIKDAKGLSPDSPIAEEIVKHYVKLSYAYSIAEKATSIVTGSGATLDDVESLIKAHDDEVGKLRFDDESIFVSCDLADVLKSVSEPGLSWRLEELNRSLGPLRTGDFIILAARPETGKTTFVASELSWFATQLTHERPIIWVNNEERSDKVMRRIIQAYFGVTNPDLEANLADLRKEYLDKIGKRIRVVNNDSGMNHIHSLDHLFKELNPCAIVFDQLDKVEGYDGEAREDLRLGKLYKWGRDCAHKYGPVIAVSQATGDDYQKWIRMSDLRGSKTDKAGEADAIVTIGKSDQEHEKYERYISIPKNKLFGGPRTVESERHASYVVEIQPTIARYKGVF